MSFDPTKTVQTQSGKPWRKYATDGGGLYPIHGAVLESNGWIAGLWTAEGKFYNGFRSGDDLVNVPEKRTLWVNCYPYSCHGYLTRKAADSGADANTRIAIIPVTFTEGEGL